MLTAPNMLLNKLIIQIIMKGILMKVINNILTDDIISNIANGIYKFVVTRDSILTSLNSRVDSLNFSSHNGLEIIFSSFAIVSRRTSTRTWNSAAGWKPGW